MSCLSWRDIFHESWENKSKFQMGGLRETGGLLLFSPEERTYSPPRRGGGTCRWQAVRSCRELVKFALLICRKFRRFCNFTKQCTDKNRAYRHFIPCRNFDKTCFTAFIFNVRYLFYIFRPLSFLEKETKMSRNRTDFIR